MTLFLLTLDSPCSLITSLPCSEAYLLSTVCLIIARLFHSNSQCYRLRPQSPFQGPLLLLSFVHLLGLT